MSAHRGSRRASCHFFIRSMAFLLLLLSLAVEPAEAEKLSALEFRNQEITDILAVLAKVSGTSIIADSTVVGRATYYFSEIEFEQALQAFLSTSKLYSQLRNDVYYVSRIRSEYDHKAGTISLDAEDVDITLLVRAVSVSAGKTVLYDPLPKRELSVHIRNVPIERALSVLVHQTPEFAVEASRDFYYIRNMAARKAAELGSGRRIQDFVTTENDLFSLNVEQGRLSDILASLFEKTGSEYSLFMRPDQMLSDLRFSGRSFDQVLRLVLEQAGGDFTVIDSIYYIFDIQKRDILKKLKATERIRLSYLPVIDLPSLLPQELSTQGFLKIDKASNSVILNGSADEIGPVRDFILLIDRPNDGMSYMRFDLKHRKIRDVLPLITARYQSLQPQIIPETNAFTVLSTAESRTELAGFLEMIDVPETTFPIQLKYISSETLLKHLPPSISSDNLVQTQDSNLIFFRGSAEKREVFLLELAMLDRPVPQIRYELLVVQYQKSKGLNWSIELSSAIAPSEGADSTFLGTIGNLLSLSFDIVSTFGYLFAVKLNLTLSENDARILADTTLNGLSGQEIKFQNTNTYRYRDFEIDPDTGKPKITGIIREITSGLIINIDGWVSGDGMITMRVSSTVSKRGADVSNQNGNPPPTSEKVVSTHVRTPSGRPVVISGLFQQEVDTGIKKVPILGDIPLLGLLFQSRYESVEDTEMVIYIVPHLEFPQLQDDRVAERLDGLYDHFVREKNEWNH